MRDKIRDVLLNHVVESKEVDTLRRVPLVDLLSKGTDCLQVGVQEVDLIVNKIAKVVSG